MAADVRILDIMLESLNSIKNFTYISSTGVVVNPASLADLSSKITKLETLKSSLLGLFENVENDSKEIFATPISKENNIPELPLEDISKEILSEIEESDYISSPVEISVISPSPNLKNLPNTPN